MTQQQRSTSSNFGRPREKRLAAYLTAAGAVGTAMASEAKAAIVFNTTEQPFGVNGDVNIDFNADGQIDYQIDHDRFDLNGTILDYLQIDKNDVSSAADPLPIDDAATFPLNSTVANDTADAGYVTNSGVLGSYPAALTAGTEIGPGASFDFQEGTNFDDMGKTIRANRLIDEDATQIDQVLGGLSADQVQVPLDGPNFLGLGGEVRYLGVKMDLNNTNSINYGWIGIRIDNEADATGAVVGYAYETQAGVGIRAGQIPEPSSIVMAALGGLALVGVAAVRWLRGR